MEIIATILFHEEANDLYIAVLSKNNLVAFDSTHGFVDVSKDYISRSVVPYFTPECLAIAFAINEKFSRITFLSQQEFLNRINGQIKN